MPLPDFKVQQVDSAGDAILTPGALDDAAWDGTGDPASVIALLKAMYAKLAEIATNTAAP